MTKTKLIEKIKKEKIEYIQLQFINMFGEMHSVEIPVSKIKDILDNQIMIDGSSIKGYTSINKSDLYLQPDLETFMSISFFNSEYKVARIICDVLNKDGSLFEGGTRSILKRIEAEQLKKGVKLYAGLEAEFFFIKVDANKNIYPTDVAKYFGVSPHDTTADLKREIVSQLIKHDFDIEAFHKEVAPGQHEINFKYDTLTKTADRMITFKWIVQTIAAKHDYLTTFMPKPFTGVNGSGLHSNLSMFKNGKNMFSKNSKMLSDTMMHFIAGIAASSREIAAITNPTVNSYKRLVPGFEAPNCIAWSDSNRSAMIRVPSSRGASTRIEVRCVDAMSNPYLMLTALFTAGLRGIEKKMKPLKPVYENLFKLSINELDKKGIKLLPSSLGEALMLMKKSKLLIELMGEELHSQYYHSKIKEWDDYRQEVHQWELDRYLKL